MHSVPEWADATQQFQKSLSDNWQTALQSFGGLAQGATPSLPAFPHLTFSQDSLQALQQAYLKEASELWNGGLSGKATAADKRFATEAWAANPVAAFSAAIYMLNGRALLGLVEAAETDAKTKARLRFAVEQWMAASAPSNFMCLNAEAQKKAIETNGES